MTQKDLDLRNICDALGSQKTKWHEIGVQLGIPYAKLKEFKKEDDPLSAVIDYWMRNTTPESLSWQCISKALRSTHIGEPGLAAAIEREHCCQTDSKETKGEKTIFCPEHSQREVELYCETCKKFICFPCIKKGEAHHDHDYEQVTKVTEAVVGETLKDTEKHQANIELIVSQYNSYLLQMIT